MQFLTPPVQSSLSLSVLLVLAHLHQGIATLGAVNIDELLISPDQQFLSSQAAPPPTKNPHAPWSHAPHCTTSSAKYCVYTLNTTGTTGISIITAPQVATEVAATLDEDVLSHFLTQDQAEYLYYNPPPYEVTRVEGKGMGVIATRRIQKWETFMVDQASLAVDLKAEEKLSGEEKKKLMGVAIERLKRPEVVRGLAGGGNEGEEEESEGEGDTEKGKMKEGWEEEIMRTNAFGTTVAGKGFSALFPLVAVSIAWVEDALSEYTNTDRPMM
jgi:hypothetical protein